MTISAQLRTVLPEWEHFAQAVQTHRPDAGTWCAGWTVRDVLIHNTGNTVEFIRTLKARMVGDPVETRSFEERETPYRAMANSDLWSAFVALCEEFVETSEAAIRDLPPEPTICFTGAYVRPDFFAKHMRNEIVLHRWDITGDDTTSTHALMQPWVTEHSVHPVGPYLLASGAARMNLSADDRIEGRLRAPGTDDILVTATKAGNTMALVPPEGEATIESDPAVRALFLWGRRPADPSRWHSQAGPDTLLQLRTLLSGF
jgi:uncharacterized protein (TIGR03083 family)